MKKVFLSLLLAFFVLLPIARGECYVTLKYKDVPLAFGNVKMPSDLYIVEFDLASITEAEKKEIEEAAMKDDSIKELMRSFDWQETLKNIRLYQVGIDDGESYRIAFFMTFSKDVQQHPEIINKYFQGEISAEEKNALLQQRVAVVDFWQKNNLVSYEDIFANSAIEKLDIETMLKEPYGKKIVFANSEEPKLDFIQIDGKQAYGLQARVLTYGMGALCSKGYFFAVDQTINGLVVMSLDSEREFWQDLFYNSLNLGIRP